jgi:hypothetical protein
MPRSLLARSLEPLAAVLWGVLLLWSVWVAVVWAMPVGAVSLGFIPGAAQPPDADLRQAVLLLARHADVAWFSLAVMNLHLVLTGANGLRVARSWLGLACGGAMVLGLANARLGLPFGRLYWGETLGVQVLGVPLGWVLLSPALVMSARESALWARPRASHSAVAAMTAVLVFLTMLNLEWPARFIRGWWVWRSADPHTPASAPWMHWVAWFVLPGLLAFAMREKTVVAVVAPRSLKPVFILAMLNAIALITRVRVWLQG